MIVSTILNNNYTYIFPHMAFHDPRGRVKRPGPTFEANTAKQRRAEAECFITFKDPSKHLSSWEAEEETKEKTPLCMHRVHNTIKRGRDVQAMKCRRGADSMDSPASSSNNSLSSSSVSEGQPSLTSPSNKINDCVSFPGVCPAVMSSKMMFALVTAQAAKKKEQEASHSRTVKAVILAHDCGHGWRFGEEQIKDTYINDYKITSLHSRLVEQYKKTKARIPELERLLEKECALTEAAKTKVSALNHKHLCNELGARIEDLHKDHTFNLFKEEVTDVLKAYSSLGSTRTVLSFKKQNSTSQSWDLVKEESELEQIKTLLVARYVDIASKYAYIKIDRVMSPKHKGQLCYNCEEKIDSRDQCSSGFLACPKCHVENPINFNSSINREDMSHVQPKEDSINNFEMALKKYMGLQALPPKKLIDKLNKHLKSRGLPTSEDVKTLPLDKYNKRGNTSCKMLIDALSSINEVKHYEDVHLIGSMLWGWKLPDLSEVKDTILHHFRVTQRVFNSMCITERWRNSALGIQFRLYAHLMVVGHKCRFDDFKIPSSRHSLNIHLNNWRIMCKKSGIPDLMNMCDLQIN